jgi:hypothetical protein
MTKGGESWKSSVSTAHRDNRSVGDRWESKKKVELCEEKRGERNNVHIVRTSMKTYFRQ